MGNESDFDGEVNGEDYAMNQVILGYATDDVSGVKNHLINKYGNITLWLMEDYDGHPFKRIKIKHFILSEELIY